MVYKYDKRNKEELKNILINRYVLGQLTSNLDFYKLTDISSVIKDALYFCNDPDKPLFNQCIDIIADVLFNLKSNIMFATTPVKDSPTFSIKNPKLLFDEQYNSESITIYIRGFRFDIGESSDIFSSKFANGKLNVIENMNIDDKLHIKTVDVDKNNLKDRIIMLIAMSHDE